MTWKKGDLLLFLYFCITKENQSKNLGTQCHPRVTLRSSGGKRGFQRVAEPAPGWPCGSEQQGLESPTICINALDSWAFPDLLCGGHVLPPGRGAYTCLPLGDSSPRCLLSFDIRFLLSSIFQEALSTKNLKNSKINLKIFFLITSVFIYLFAKAAVT